MTRAPSATSCCPPSAAKDARDDRWRLTTAKLWPSFQWRYLLLLPVAAGIVHLIATFAGHVRHAQLGVTSACQAGASGQHHEGAGAGQAGPAAAAVLSARRALRDVPVFVARGPVDVKAVLPDRGWTLGVYHPDGTTAYFAAGSAGRIDRRLR